MAEGHLNRTEVLRYGRHLLLPEIGLEGQERLRNASVLVVGAGGLGSPAALYCAAAGFGRLGIADADTVDPSNLQRQILYSEPDIGASKVERAVLRLREFNRGVRVEPIQVRVDASNALAIVAEYDLVIDATDNFETRYLLADVSALTGRPVVHGAVHGFEGQVSVFGLPGRPCYRCLHPVPPPPGLAPGCGEAGVLGAATGVIGSLQAVEAVKLAAGAGEPLAGRLLHIDLRLGRFETIEFDADPSCPACGRSATPEIRHDYTEFCGAADPVVRTVTAIELARRLVDPESVQLIDVRRPHEAHIVSIGGIVIPEFELPARMSELDPARPVVCYCRSGIRSARAAALLEAAGFSDVAHLAGGLFSWAATVDPDIPLY